MSVHAIEEPKFINLQASISDNMYEMNLDNDINYPEKLTIKKIGTDNSFLHL